jgi:hypothetical protein
MDTTIIEVSRPEDVYALKEWVGEQTGKIQVGSIKVSQYRKKIVGSCLRGFDRHVNLAIGGYDLFVAWNDDPLDLRIQLQFHCSHFDTFGQLTRWIFAAMGQRGVDMILDARVKRIDQCIDIKLPPETIWRVLSQTRVTEIARWKSKESTLYFGRPNNRYYRIYPKTVRSDLHFDFVPENYVNSDLMGTRIEVQCKGKNCPISSLRDVRKLLLTNPFSSLKTASIPEELLKSLPPNQVLKIEGFLRYRDQYGIAAARRHYNRKNKNFHRDIGRFIGPVDLLDLGEAWKHRISRYLDDGRGNEVSDR